MNVLAFLVIAALLEVLGDAAMRAGLAARSPWWLLVGAAYLVSYGFVVNLDRQMDLGRLLGAYIAVFFVVSQIAGAVLFHERPPASRLVGGLFVVIGGVIVFFGAK